jgi:hypothetical protein
MKVFTLFDSVVGTHGPLFQAPNRASMVRSLQDAVAAGKIENAADQVLRLVGRYDPETGRITPQDPTDVIALSVLVDEDAFSVELEN